MVTFNIVPEHTALLLIDMQRDYLTPGSKREIPAARDLLPRFNQLISVCRQKGVLIIFTKHAHRPDGKDAGLFKEFVQDMAGRSLSTEGTPGVEISDGLNRENTDVVITKQVYSAFNGTNLDHILRVQGIDTLIIGGIVLPFCVESTTREARHRNYKVILLSDGTATYDTLADMGWGAVSADEAHKVILTVMALRFAEVLSVEQVLSRLNK